MNTPLSKLDDFTKAYLECALWSTNDESDPSGGESLDENYDFSDISPELLAEMGADCKQFQDENWDDISENPTRAGYDFWLTRNHHGAGFWDGDWPEPVGKRLTKSSEFYGEVDLYVGDDGMIYCD